MLAERDRFRRRRFRGMPQLVVLPLCETMMPKIDELSCLSTQPPHLVSTIGPSSVDSRYRDMRDLNCP
jgi:hypothetical protein